MQGDFSKIHVDDLQFVYEYIEEKLEYIIEKSYSDWTPSDVHEALKNKDADLYIGYEGNEKFGFVVVTTQENYGSGPTLYVWAAYQNPKYGYTKMVLIYWKSLQNNYKQIILSFKQVEKAGAKLPQNMVIN